MESNLCVLIAGIALVIIVILVGFIYFMVNHMAAVGRQRESEIEEKVLRAKVGYRREVNGYRSDMSDLLISQLNNVNNELYNMDASHESLSPHDKPHYLEKLKFLQKQQNELIHLYNKFERRTKKITDKLKETNDGSGS